MLEDAVTAGDGNGQISSIWEEGALYANDPNLNDSAQQSFASPALYLSQGVVLEG